MKTCIVCEREVPLEDMHEVVSPLHGHKVWFCIDTEKCLSQAPIKAPDTLRGKYHGN